MPGRMPHGCVGRLHDVPGHMKTETIIIDDPTCPGIDEMGVVRWIVHTNERMNIRMTRSVVQKGAYKLQGSLLHSPVDICTVDSHRRQYTAETQ